MSSGSLELVDFELLIVVLWLDVIPRLKCI
jgi:hypothetical protein